MFKQAYVQIEGDSMDNLALDCRLSEFQTQQEADEYNSWLHAKIVEARNSETVSHEEALAHFAAKRIERLQI